MTPLLFDDRTVRDRTTEKVFDRAEAMLAREDVVHLARRGDDLYGAVRGSEPRPYRVRVALTASGVRGATCSCPYSFGGWCKHIAAVLLSAIEMPLSIPDLPPLADSVAAQDAKRLQDVVLGLALEHPELLEEIEARLNGEPFDPPEWDLGGDGDW